MDDTRADLLDDPPGELWSCEPVTALATWAMNGLYRAQIGTVRVLTECTAQDLLDIRQFGKGQLAEVRRVLGKHGLSLAGESS